MTLLSIRIVCIILDLYVYRPDALKSTFGLGALFNSDVRLFWCPSEMCQIVEKTLEEKDAKKKHAKGFLNSVKNMLAPSDKIKGAWGKNSWWLAERNECFIGVCCTGKTYALSSNSKDAKFELKKGSVVKMRVSSWFEHVVLGRFDNCFKYQMRCYL